MCVVQSVAIAAKRLAYAALRQRHCRSVRLALHCRSASPSSLADGYSNLHAVSPRKQGILGIEGHIGM